MTDKQIIIDGVDVSGCCFYEKHYTEDEDVEIKHFCKIFHYHCETEPNCYYKNWKRKEQECKELKEENYELTEEVSIDRALFAEIDQLKAELEQEKALKETYLACYKAKHDDIEGKLFKLSKTLTEIKEIAEENCKLCFSVDGFKKPDDCGICEYAKILQKISECEVEDADKT